MALAAGRSPGAARASQVRRYQPPSGCGARSRAAMSYSPGALRQSVPLALSRVTSVSCRTRPWTPRRRGSAAPHPPKSAPFVSARFMKRCPSCSQVKPIPPKDCRLSPHTMCWQSSGRLRHGDRDGAVGRVLVDGRHREVAQRAGPLDREEHVAHLVLDRLEGADGHTELLAVLHVRQDHLEERIARRRPSRARCASVASSRARVTPARRGVAPRFSQRPVVGDHDLVERDGGEGPAVIERVHRGQADLGQRDDERADTCARPRHRRPPRTRLRERRRPSLVPCKIHPPSARSAVMVTCRPSPPRGWSLDGQRPGDVARGDLGQETLALLGTVPTSRTMGANCVMVGSSGPGTTARPSSSTTTAVSTIGEPDAAVLLGNGQGRPIQRDHRSPELLGRLTGLDDGADELERALLLEERPDRGAQLFLLARELELHRPPSPAVR